MTEQEPIKELPPQEPVVEHLDFIDVTGMTAEDVRRMGHADE
jgi:hypothetical protein